MKNSENSPDQKPEPKVYQSPVLKIYGDIGAITLGGSKSPRSDHGMNSMS